MPWSNNPLSPSPTTMDYYCASSPASPDMEVTWFGSDELTSTPYQDEAHADCNQCINETHKSLFTQRSSKSPLGSTQTTITPEAQADEDVDVDIDNDGSHYINERLKSVFTQQIIKRPPRSAQAKVAARVSTVGLTSPDAVQLPGHHGTNVPDDIPSASLEEKSLLAISDNTGRVFYGRANVGGKMNGSGTFTRTTSAGDRIEFIGNVKSGKFNGNGKLTDASANIIYEGEFQNGAAHGTGWCRYQDAFEYVGEWNCNKHHGEGVSRELTARGESYNGEWRNNQRNGVGTLILAEGGGQYKGSFVDHQFHGHGTMEYPDSSRYCGEFVAGIRSGDGEMMYTDGGYYAGEWRAGWRNGIGTMFQSDGTTYRGRYLNNVKDGIGFLHGTKDNPTMVHQKWRIGVMQLSAESNNG